MEKVPEFAAFPRYRDMNVRNLLYYKAQIDNLRIKILKQEEETTLEMERYDEIADEADSAYHMMLMEMRQLLKDYSMFATMIQIGLHLLQLLQTKHYFNTRTCLHYQILKRITCALYGSGWRQILASLYVAQQAVTEHGASQNLQNLSGVKLRPF